MSIISIIVYLVFIVYIIFSILYLREKRKTKKSLLSFMTSFLILFTCTAITASDFFSGSGFMENKREMISNLGGMSSEGDSIQFDSRGSIEKGTYKLYKQDNPEPAPKTSAYLDNASPAKNTMINLIVTGPPGGKVTAVCHYKNHGTPYIWDIGGNGQAVIPIKVEPDAESGVSVVIDVKIEHNGKSYSLYTAFIPQ